MTSLTFTLGDRTINRLGFGAMRITGRGIWGPPPDRETARRVVRRAYELGCTLIDTADSYGPGVSEEIIAEALHPYPEDLVIATKAGLTRSGPNRWHADCRPEHLKRAVEESLWRLKLDRIEVLQLHTVDRKVPYAESVGALKELQDAGKIRHVGVSNVSVENLREAQSIVDVVSVQNRYNADDRSSEDVLEACDRDGIGFIPWKPLAGNAPPPQELAALLERSEVMLPIPGTGSLEHLEENMSALELLQ